jgi:hypothetical protein
LNCIESRAATSRRPIRRPLPDRSPTRCGW